MLSSCTNMKMKTVVDLLIKKELKTKNRYIKQIGILSLL